MVGYSGCPVKIRLHEGLPYITVSLTYRGQQLTLKKVILDFEIEVGAMEYGFDILGHRGDGFSHTGRRGH